MNKTFRYMLNIQTFAKPKKFDEREEDEKKEGYKEVKSGLPEGNFQKTKQVLTPDQMSVDKKSIPEKEGNITTANVADAAKALKDGIKVKPDVSVEQLKNRQVGGVPLAEHTGVLNSVAGVSTVSPVDDMSRIPYSKGGIRQDSRFGKKRSEDLFEMDNTICEQNVPLVDDSKDLRESPDSDQGYNGRKQFKEARAKKNAYFARTVAGAEEPIDGKLPQQLLNDASVDFDMDDKLVYTCGQVIDENLDPKAGYPKVRTNKLSADNPQYRVIMQKGNYKPKNLHIKIHEGLISKVYIEEDKHIVSAGADVREQANMNWQIDANNVAATMLKLQNELGRETMDKWSPLGYVIEDPYEYNMLLHDIEATTGALSALGYRSAVSSLAFQRNILGKDGINPQTNAIKMFMEGYHGTFANTSRNVLKNIKFAKAIFNAEEYKKGSAAALIAMFDTVGKYSTKADMLGLQRSLTLHLQQGDNNINPLHCHPNFVKAMDKAHMFSTIDGGYNPYLPIMATKLIKVVNPLSLNIFLKNWKNPYSFTGSDYEDDRRNKDTGSYAIYMYKYQDQRRITYYQQVRHPLIEGLLLWMLKNQGNMVKAYGEEADIVIPFEFNFQAPNMLSFMLCSAAQYIVLERNRIFRDVFYAGDQTETYIWDDLVGLDKLNPLYSTQLTIGKYNEALKLGKLANDTAIRQLWGTHMCIANRNNGGPSTAVKAQYFLPFYFNEVALQSTYTKVSGFYRSDKMYNVTWPSIRRGVRHEYIDLINGMSERDFRLCLDRWVDIPRFVNESNYDYEFQGMSLVDDNVDEGHIYDVNDTAADVNSYIKLASLRYEANSDGRVTATYEFEQGLGGIAHHMDEHALYCLPKELGWIDECYDGYQLITDISLTNNGNTFSVSTATISAHDTIDNCRVYNGFSPRRIISYKADGHSITAQSLDRSAALSQVYYTFCACSQADTWNEEFIKETGIVPCLSATKYADYSAAPFFNLNGNGDTDAVLNKFVKTRAPLVWTMLQRYFLPINVFENCLTSDYTQATFDPLETSFYFGVCGTLASDYTQNALERLDVHDQLGLDYTEDYFMKQSLIFK